MLPYCCCYVDNVLTVRPQCYSLSMGYYWIVYGSRSTVTFLHRASKQEPDPHRRNWLSPLLINDQSSSFKILPHILFIELWPDLFMMSSAIYIGNWQRIVNFMKSIDEFLCFLLQIFSRALFGHGSFALLYTYECKNCKTYSKGILDIFICYIKCMKFDQLWYKMCQIFCMSLICHEI